MTTLPPGSMPPLEQLVALLRRQARGYYPAEAAVELVIAHGSWLRRPDFLAGCVAYDDSGDFHPDPVAFIDWTAVAELVESVACSSSEERILRLACELAGEDTCTALPELLTGLDDHNQTLVVQAVRHAMGNRPGHLHNHEALDDPALQDLRRRADAIREHLDDLGDAQ